MKIKQLISVIVILALFVTTISVTIMADNSNNVIKVFDQQFETQDAFNTSVTTGSYQSNPGKWGPAPDTVTLTASDGKDSVDDKSLMIDNRKTWQDSARIRLNTSTIQAGKTYRLTTYLKNDDSTKGLWLTPAVTFYGADGQGGFPSKTDYGNDGADLGYTNADNKNGWVKYTDTFYITEDKTTGICEFHGFGLGIQLSGCNQGYVVMEFFFVTPGGNTALETCPFSIDSFTIYDITNGTDPETIQNSSSSSDSTSSQINNSSSSDSTSSQINNSSSSDSTSSQSGNSSSSSNSSGSEPISVFDQQFETQDVFNTSITTESYQSNPGKWGPAPDTVTLTSSAGKDGGGDKSLMIDNRNSWEDSARIRLNTSTIQAGKTYRLTTYLKNDDSTKGLWLTPAVTFYGADGQGGFPSKTEYGNDGADLGYTNAVNKTGWVKYTDTFYITEDKTTGICEFHGFGMDIQLTGCNQGYVVMEFFFVTPGGNTALETCPFSIDSFTIYDITSGTDPETVQNNSSSNNSTSSQSDNSSSSEPISVFDQQFETQDAFNTSITTGSYQSNPGKWGSAPDTVALKASAGKDGGDDKSLMIDNRKTWQDSARIRLNTSTIQAGKTYRLITYLKNDDPTKGLWLTPAVTLYGADGKGGFPNKTNYGSKGADLGYVITGNKTQWVKYSDTFYITEDKTNGTCEFHGFGMDIQLTGCNQGYVVVEFFFTTPDGNAALETCPFSIDSFSIYDITNGKDPDPNGSTSSLSGIIQSSDSSSNIQIGTYALTDGTFPVLRQDFENPNTYFSTLSNSANFFNTPGEWGPALSSTVKLVAAGNAESGNKCVEVSNRKQWVDSARIWINNSMLTADTTYRLTIYVKNGDPSKPLRLSPGINLYGSNVDGSKVTYPSKSDFLPQFVDFSNLGSQWFKLTTTFTINENRDLGELTFDGFGGQIQLFDCNSGFAAFEFMLSSPMGVTELDTCPYYIDNFSIYDISDGIDPENPIDWTNVNTGDHAYPIAIGGIFTTSALTVLLTKKRRKLFNK